MANFKSLIVVLVLVSAQVMLTNAVSAQEASIKVSVGRRGAAMDRQRMGGLGDARSFTTYLEEGRSYECAVYGNNTSTTGEDPAVFIDVGNISDGTSNTIVIGETGNASPIINGDPTDSTKRNRGRVTIIPERSARYTFPFQLSVDNGGNWPSGTGDFTMWAECYETTLYGGFNTFINNFNFLELTNTSSVEVSGKIRAVDSEGNVVIDNQAFTVPANRRFDFDLHTPIGPQKYGTVTIMHYGPAHTLTGYVSQYKGTASNFDLVVSLPVSERR